MNKRLSICFSALLFCLAFFPGRIARSQDSGYDVPPASDVTQAVWDDFMAGNRRYVRGTPAMFNLIGLRREYYNGFRPKAIVLACGDSRSAPERVFDQSLGTIFVVRTAGNVVDSVALGSIEYAFEQQNPQVLVILGHEHCGMVKMVCDNRKMTSPAQQAIFDRISPVVNPLRGKYTGDDFWVRAIRANVFQVTHDILAQSPILRDAVDKKKLTVVEAYLHVESGEVERINP